MPALSWPHITPILLLIGSNAFMTLAWYGHLKFKSAPILMVILISWSLAFVEYCLAVPANRYGHAVYSAAELKTMQEVITLSVFVIFSWLYLNEPLTVRHLIGFALIAAGAGVIFLKPAAVA
ncbi:MAG: DMT family protein [Oceanicaulis sp.]